MILEQQPGGQASQSGNNPLDRLGPPPMSEAEMAVDIEDRFEAISKKKAELDTRKISDKNKLEEMRHKLLGEFFETLKSMGVDPGDQEALAIFMAKLERESPDLLELLETAFNTLMPEGQTVPAAQVTGQFGGLKDTVGDLAAAPRSLPERPEIETPEDMGEPMEEQVEQAPVLPPEMAL